MIKIKIPWARPDIGQEELTEIEDSFRLGWLSMGPKVGKLEQNFCSFLNVPYAIAVSNGTVALDLILKAVGVGLGDEVIVPAMTFFATASAVSYQHAIPVFVDIERKTFNLDPERISEAITKKTKAIIFIDYGGNPADYDNIAEIGRKYGIVVIQDGAQSLGGIYKGNPTGAQAKVSSMSFHMAKVMTTIEGGMIYCRNKSLWEDIIKRRNHGEPNGKKYRHVILGTNARMSDLQAGVGLAQLRKLPGFIKERKRVAARYDKLFTSKKRKISIAATMYKDSINAYFFYPILIDNRDSVANRLRVRYGIDTRVAYPLPLWKQEVYSSGKLKYRRMKCPAAEYVTSKILNLPIYPSMTNDEIDYVAMVVLAEL